MNSTQLPTELVEGIQEKYMSALQLHTGIGDQDTGAVNLALGMALCDLDAAWQRRYDLQMVLSNTLAHDNARLLERIGAITKQTSQTSRNGDNGNGMHAQPGPAEVETDGPDLAGLTIDEQVMIAQQEYYADLPEADEDAAPLQLAAVDDDEDAPPFQYRWEGLPEAALTAIADMELGTRPWRVFSLEIRRAITIAAIRELQAAQYDGAALTTAEYNRSKPQWMPNYSTLFSTLAMTWRQMVAAAEAWNRTTA